MNLIEYGLNVLIFGNVFIAAFLFEIGVNGVDFLLKYKGYSDKLNIFFILSSIFSIWFIQLRRLSFNYYTPFLLTTYIGFICITYMGLYNNSRYFLQSLSVAVLLVFLNSYIWESILHLSVYHVNIRELFNFREIWRLSALWILARYYKIRLGKKDYAMNLFKILLFINFLFSVLYIEVFWSIPNKIVFFGFSVYELKVIFMYFNRLISLILLTDIFKKCMELKNKINWWFV